MTEIIRKTILECISCIWYFVNFQKDQDITKALFNLKSKANKINPVFTKKLGLRIRQTDIGAQKINRSYLNTFRMIIISFSLQNKLEKV